MAIMLPSLREERAQTYSPFLPIHPETGVVMQVPIEERNVDAGTASSGAIPTAASASRRRSPAATAKLQWKPDWAMRWAALGVDYEMSGKDLIDSVKLASRRSATALGGTPPEGFNYELFLDEKGQKISKSKGNGLTIDEWLTYAPTESLGALSCSRSRATAKKLYFDVIPRRVDEYYAFLAAYARQDWTGAARQSGLAHA